MSFLHRDSFPGNPGSRQRGWDGGDWHPLSEERFLYTEYSHLSVAPLPPSAWPASGSLQNPGELVDALDSALRAELVADSCCPCQLMMCQGQTMSHADRGTAATRGEQSHDPLDKAIKLCITQRESSSGKRRAFFGGRFFKFMCVTGTYVVLIMCQAVFKTFYKYYLIKSS